MNIVQTITAALNVAAFLGALTFMLMFRRVGWHRSAIGRHCMFFFFVCTVLLGLRLVVLVVGRDYWGHEWVSLGSYGLLAWAMWGQVLVFRRVRRGERA